MTLTPGHLTNEQRKILRAVALAYRRVMRAPVEPASTRGEISRRDQRRQTEALAAVTSEYRRLNPSAPLEVSGEVNRIAAAINVIPRRFCPGRIIPLWVLKLTAARLSAERLPACPGPTRLCTGLGAARPRRRRLYPIENGHNGCLVRRFHIEA